MTDRERLAREMSWQQGHPLYDEAEAREVMIPAMQEMALDAALPGYGAGAGVRETRKALEEGDYLTAGLEAAMTAADFVPFLGMMIPAARVSRSVARQAERALDSGADPDEIYEATRMFRDVDGIMKYEVSDAPMQTVYWGGLPPATNDMRVGDYMVEHPEFLKYYPEAADLKLRLNDQRDPRWGYYSESQGEIGLKEFSAADKGKEFSDFVVTDPPRNSRGTLIHELQHFIQQKEGWPSGGSSKSFVPSTEIPGFRAARGLAKEVDDFYKAAGFSADTIRYAKRHQPKMIRDKLEEIVSAREALGIEVPEERVSNALMYLTDPGTKKKFDYLIYAQSDPRGLSMSEYETYQALAGEVEARNADLRSMMDPRFTEITSPARTRPVSPERIRFREEKYRGNQGFAAGGAVSIDHWPANGYHSPVVNDTVGRRGTHSADTAMKMPKTAGGLEALDMGLARGYALGGAVRKYHTGGAVHQHPHPPISEYVANLDPTQYRQYPAEDPRTNYSALIDEIEGVVEGGAGGDQPVATGGQPDVAGGIGGEQRDSYAPNLQSWDEMVDWADDLEKSGWRDALYLGGLIPGVNLATGLTGGIADAINYFGPVGQSSRAQDVIANPGGISNEDYIDAYIDSYADVRDWGFDYGDTADWNDAAGMSYSDPRSPDAADDPGFAAGGAVAGLEGAVEDRQQQAEDILIDRAYLALKGQEPNPEPILDAFVRRYGQQALAQLRQQVMVEEQQGRLIDGPGGPTDDAIPAVIDKKSPARLSDGEFVMSKAAVDGAGGPENMDVLHQQLVRKAKA